MLLSFLARVSVRLIAGLFVAVVGALGVLCILSALIGLLILAVLLVIHDITSHVSYAISFPCL